METIATIESSLDELENVLQPLLENDFSETLTKLDTLQQAKLQVALPHIVLSLVASYLEMRDIDPVTHDVSPELARIGQYFAKIESAANGPEKRTMAVDQQAATRFIKHAIREAGQQGTHIRFNTTETTAIKATVTTSGVVPETSTSSVIGAKLTPAALAKIEERKKALVENDDGDDDDAQMLSDEDGLMVVDEVVSPITSKSGGGQKEKQKEEEGPNFKKKRKGIDPWTGFEDSATSAANTPIASQKNTEKVQDPVQSVVSKLTTRKPRHKKKKKQPTDIIDVDAESGSNGDNSQANTQVQGGTKKKRKESKESKADVVISISSD